MSELPTTTFTWTALLGRWMDFARGAVAARGESGERLRASVPAVIELQAVTLALGEIERVAALDRPHAPDRAALLIARSTAAIEDAWRGEEMSQGLRSLCADARRALERSLYAGATELLWTGSEPAVFPHPLLDRAHGTLAVMQPGTIVMPGEPVAWWCEQEGVVLPRDVSAATAADCFERRPPPNSDIAFEIAVPRQVYRQIDDAGRFVRDVVAPVTDDAPAGLPLLVPICEAGRAIGDFTLEAAAWEAHQRSHLAAAVIPVVVRG